MFLLFQTLDEKGEGKGGTGGEGSGGKEGEEGKEEPELELSITDSPFASDEEITSFRPSPRLDIKEKDFLMGRKTGLMDLYALDLSPSLPLSLFLNFVFVWTRKQRKTVCKSHPL